MIETNKGRFAVAIGTRPEAIKLMPVIRELERRGHSPLVFLTGQHRDLLSGLLEELGIHPNEDLNLMRAEQSLADLSARALVGMSQLLLKHQPDTLIVQGDTTTAAMSALSAFYQRVRVAHVEAGLRTGDLGNPFPEEMNRRLTAELADVHFAPTETSLTNLRRAGVPKARIHLVGNTIVDAVRTMSVLPKSDHRVHELPDPLVLVTLHRRESSGPDLLAICSGIRQLAEELVGSITVVFPVHPTPAVRRAVDAVLDGVPGVHLIDPLPYAVFLTTLSRARLVITDSGGVQEEAATLGVPVLVARRVTERPEAVEAGVAELVGADANKLLDTARRLLTNEEAHRVRAMASEVFGDGHAAEKIVAILLGLRAQPSGP